MDIDGYRWILGVPNSTWPKHLPMNIFHPEKTPPSPFDTEQTTYMNKNYMWYGPTVTNPLILMFEYHLIPTNFW